MTNDPNAKVMTRRRRYSTLLCKFHALVVCFGILMLGINVLLPQQSYNDVTGTTTSGNKRNNATVTGAVVSVSSLMVRLEANELGVPYQ
eukprot:scaffold222373_cov35-Attheya_sp.AAC.1